MAFPLSTVLTAAPGILSAAADLIKLIRNRKQSDTQQQLTAAQLDEVVTLLEQQAVVIEELARNNSELALAVRNNRRLAVGTAILAVTAIVVAVVV
ncbi:MAG: hypothetical protein OEZ39_14990 [Gammaproteobacteria bacterium]|nr:hypothetical protein [Gammaproteobacteria bacterium]MDH5653159.1 hypothetical protein [Gammaproteobacteria bacterium]